MLCVLKKNGKLRTVFDLRQQNDNTEKDVSPFMDQDTIRHDVARALFRSKLDMSEAYEQIRVRPDNVPKTVFATIFGTFVSLVMQQGDCNAPSNKVDDGGIPRIHRLIRPCIPGRYLHILFDH